jgi:hypothetical protein
VALIFLSDNGVGHFGKTRNFCEELNFLYLQAWIGVNVLIFEVLLIPTPFFCIAIFRMGSWEFSYDGMLTLNI